MVKIFRQQSFLLVFYRYFISNLKVIKRIIRIIDGEVIGKREILNNQSIHHNYDGEGIGLKSTVVLFCKFVTKISRVTHKSIISDLF